MSRDYIPSGDTEFTPWVANFLSYVQAHTAELGLEADDVDPLVMQQTNWNFAYGEHMTAQATARSKREQKDTMRDILESSIRALVARLQASPLVDDVMREAMGITVRGGVHVASAESMTHPIGWVDINERLRHTVNFRNNSGTTGTAKPAGTTGCEVWVKIGDTPPTGPSELRFLGVATRTPYTVIHDEADAGKMAHYMLRWLSTRGEPGPWSETVSATIAA